MKTADTASISIPLRVYEGTIAELARCEVRIAELEAALRQIAAYYPLPALSAAEALTVARKAQDALFSIENVEKPGKVSRLCTCTNDRRPGQPHMKTCSQSAKDSKL